MINILKILWVSILLIPVQGFATIIYSEADSIIFENYKQEFIKKKDLPINDLVTETALFFLDKPYVANTLESNSDKEYLTINLREFDCTTLVESCIALSLTVKSSKCTFFDFCHNLQDIRYRKGQIEDYSSRMHYVSDWMHEHEKDKTLKNISKNIGGQIHNKTISFMSSNPGLYPQLSKNKELQQKIKKVESQLNKRGGYYVVSKEKVYTSQNAMENGDLIIFSTNIPLLDFTHMGIIIKKGDKVGFVHASSVAKKVIVEKKSLQSYCNNSKRCDGVVILRLNKENN